MRLLSDSNQHFLVRLTRFFTSENEDTAREHGTSWHTDSGATGITVPPAQGATTPMDHMPFWKKISGFKDYPLVN